MTLTTTGMTVGTVTTELPLRMVVGTTKDEVERESEAEADALVAELPPWLPLLDCARTGAKRPSARPARPRPSSAPAAAGGSTAARPPTR